MLWIVFGAVFLPFEDGPCADKAAAKPATSPKDTTTVFRFIRPSLTARERCRNEAPNTAQPNVQTLLLPLCGSAVWTVANATRGDAPSSSFEVSVTSGRTPPSVDAGIATMACAVAMRWRR